MRMKRFIHGNTYYSHANPPEELDRNFKQMKNYGINTVRVAEIWPGWSVIEQRPGVYDFSILDDYVNKAEANGLEICMGIGINDTPSWLYHRYKELRFRSHNGSVSSRRVQSADFNHKEYRQHMKKFIEAMTKHYSSRKGITSWQFGNEIRYNVGLCDSEPTRIRFRQWLNHRFDGHISELNKAWGTYYQSFEEVYPYRSCEGAPTEGNGPHCLCTQEFQRWSIGELISWGIGIMKQYTTHPIFHNNFGQPEKDHWLMAKPCDIVVIDIYATTYSNPGFYNGMLIDTARSIANQQKKPLWIGETSAGQYGTYNRINTDQRLIENCIIEQIGAGAEAVFYFRHKAPIWEQPHKFTGSQTLVRIDESETEYIKTPKSIKELMNQHEDIILNAESLQPEIGVYYPLENIEFAKQASYLDIARESACGARAIWAGCQMPVELLPTEEMVEGNLSRFKIIHIPVTYLMPLAVGQALKKYVSGGGTLICEGRPAYVDEHGLLYKKQPGAGFHELIGALEDKFFNVDQCNMKVELHDSGVHIEEELCLPGLVQTLRVTSGNPIATTQDQVTGTHNKYGKGHVYYFGSGPSLHFKVGKGKYDKGDNEVSKVDINTEREKICRLYMQLAKKHGVNRPVSFNGAVPNLAVRYLKGDGYTLMFAINYDEHNDVSLDLSDESRNIVQLKKEGKKSLRDKQISIRSMSYRIIQLEDKPTFFIGIDSDGTVFDTMEIKHKRVFIPLAIEKWGLQAFEKEFMAVAEAVNLYSNFRGVNRFVALKITFELLQKQEMVERKELRLPNYGVLEDYLESHKILSVHTLREFNKNRRDSFINELIQWSEEGDALLNEITSKEGNEPFCYALKSLKRMGENVKTVVVSSASQKALKQDWGQSGLLKYVDDIAGQEVGCKKNQLRKAKKYGYHINNALMIGDALGDLEAAKAHNMLFYPIIPNKEADSWKGFYEEAYKKFINGTYQGEYEKQLIHNFMASIPSL